MEQKLKAPTEFLFPFTPYSIQKDFMHHLFNSLEEGKLGIFESPTGTGKSLSLICGTFCWMLNHEDRERCQLKTGIADLMNANAKLDSGGSGDWLSEQADQAEIKRKIEKLQFELNKIQVKDEKLQKLRSKKKVHTSSEKPYSDFNQKEDLGTSINVQDIGLNNDDDDDILLDNSEFEEAEPENLDDEQEGEEYEGIKVYFCSRTHSQLAQFVSEVQHSPYSENIRLVSLASRQSYCINKNVQRLKNMSLINERCIDLQRGKKGHATTKDTDGKVTKRAKGSSGCPHLQQKGVENLRDQALLQVLDVEQLVTRGQKLSACPYYSSRSAVKDAQVVVLPYNTLLHKATREAWGIKLAGNVVIIDEAHNLLDTIGHIHSSEVSGQQLAHAYSQLTQYRDRYQKRFNARNLLYLNQIIFIIGKLVKILGGKPGCNPVDVAQKGVDTKLYTMADFVLTAEIDNLNIYTLLAFCEKSKVAHKLHGYVERYHPTVVVNTSKAPPNAGIRAFLKEIQKGNADKSTPTQVEPAVTPAAEVMSNNPLLAVLSFLESLTNRCEDGRVVCDRQMTVGRGKLKFLLLNPAAHFADIVKQCRAVVVAGGTMQPLQEFKDQLFISAGGDPSRISVFSCGHVIPAENILPIALTQGPTNKQLDFSYQSRNTATMLAELVRVLSNVCNIVPAGVVCFFPSYDYEKIVYEYMEKTGALARLGTKKQIFREPKRAGLVEKVLTDFTACIAHIKKNPRHGGVTGALLLSVVGGKMSEGLNFADDMGRCVILVGLPYPNIKSPELQEKMKYLNAKVGLGAGQTHYENLCMKAVNQSIGRAVRHQADYSAVLLLDQRFARPRTQQALPAWIQTSLQTHTTFGPMFKQLVGFFAARKAK